jgi:hypothetical protein
MVLRTLMLLAFVTTPSGMRCDILSAMQQDGDGVPEEKNGNQYSHENSDICVIDSDHAQR